MDRKASRRYSNVNKEFRGKGNVVINVKKHSNGLRLKKYVMSILHQPGIGNNFGNIMITETPPRFEPCLLPKVLHSTPTIRKFNCFAIMFYCYINTKRRISHEQNLSKCVH